jgi:hypothetical protein
MISNAHETSPVVRQLGVGELSHQQQRAQELGLPKPSDRPAVPPQRGPESDVPDLSNAGSSRRSEERYPQDGGPVFISSASADRGLAHKIAEALNARGIRTFIDADLAAGDIWVERIFDAIRSSRIMIVLVSKYWAESASSFAELSIAMGGTRNRIIPVVLDDNSVPPMLAPYHQFRMPKGGTEEEVDELASLVSAELRTGSTTRSPAGPAKDKINAASKDLESATSAYWLLPEQRRTRALRGAVVAVAAVLLIGVLAFVVAHAAGPRGISTVAVAVSGVALIQSVAGVSYVFWTSPGRKHRRADSASEPEATGARRV